MYEKKTFFLELREYPLNRDILAWKCMQMWAFLLTVAHEYNYSPFVLGVLIDICFSETGRLYKLNTPWSRPEDMFYVG